jgi:hypothetical protein
LQISCCNELHTQLFANRLLPACLNCGGKKIKKPPFTFITELPYIRRLLDTVQKHESLQLCVFDITPGSYDDIMLQLVDVFSGSKDWNEYLKTQAVNKQKAEDYDEELVTRLMGHLDIIKQVDRFVSDYKFTTGSLKIAGDSKHFISKKELKRLGKNTELKIPLPDHLKMQLHGKRID